MRPTLNKLLIIILITLISPFLASSVASAEQETDEVEDALLDEVSLEGVQEYWNLLINDYGGYLPELEKTSLYDAIKNGGSFSLKNIVTGFVDYFFHEIIQNGRLLGLLLMLTLFSSILQTMHNAFERSAISKVAYFVVYIVLIFIALNSFYSAVSYATEAIDTMSSFMIALLPLVLGLMATFGNVVAVSFFHPIIIFLVNFSGILISNFIIPLLFMSALLLIVSSLSDDYKVTHLANLFKTVGMGTLGVFFTIFLGVMSVQGAVSAIQDGVAMKTAKFITGNFIPVVGRTFTDAADTILSATLLLKNAVGVVGLIIIVFFTLFPAIKIFAIAIIYKIAAAVLQPIGDGPVITSLNTISNYIIYVFACLLAVSFMFLLAIVIIVVASNITLLLR
ncbi:stage III sporulation protein AE [Virgibacillus natechei]|uniref:Stage III sporulation protein AE n=1 Tax=Virgibacillus natechei TaxID=1216297 RepID=A0ABS4IH05_9BACI|nr:stage III sporulation protein AE [Virgibacillus natechei]MBP1969716.1 stage III sporulation protein AE [Virgibacillus natechei]UZD11441.1 stage III sporulation protein AE [Virgibacillus natechei]